MDVRAKDVTDEDLDKLSGIMVLGMHIAALCCKKMEQVYKWRYEKSDEYKAAVKKIGRAAADTLTEYTLVKMLRHDARTRVGDLIKAFQRVEYLMETFTKTTLDARAEDATEVEIYDALHNNTNYWCYIYAMMSNFTKPEDFIKVESQIKLLAKGGYVSQNVINMFNTESK